MSTTSVMPTRTRSGANDSAAPSRQRSNTRRRRGPAGAHAPVVEPTVTDVDDTAVVPVNGIVDVLDGYAFVRTSGYLAGPNDVYVSMAQIKRYGLRRGDAVTG